MADTPDMQHDHDGVRDASRCYLCTRDASARLACKFSSCPLKATPASASTRKDTNPKDSVGTKKAYLSTLPMGVLLEMGLGFLEGARKGYGRHNYRISGVLGSVYFDAAVRHLAAWWEGEDIDPDSGLSHVTKALCCLTVLRDGMIVGNWADDRPPRLPEGWLDALNKKAAEIVARYPEPTPPFTQKEHGK